VKKLIFVVSLCFGFSAQALTWEEAEYLSKLSKSLEQAKTIADRASLSADDGRVQFKYKALKKDLTEMQTIISAHLNKPLQPRTIAELTLSYSDVKPKED